MGLGQWDGPVSEDRFPPLPGLGGGTGGDPFHALQQQLRNNPLLDFQTEASRDILVIPSISLAVRELTKVQGVLHYEERMLCELIQLRNPHTRLIYVTSQPLPPMVVDYYLQLLPGIPFSHARNRLLLLSIYDNSIQPLTQKILQRTRLVQRIANALRPDRSLMTCFVERPSHRDQPAQGGHHPPLYGPEVFDQWPL
ncbi:hypothetical protein PROH_00225 [Prochlorothrix hollandica PCC 9006 = CALU 1027]|uniref:Carboxylate-amine ligase n=1 Tax=Prochlorothrix hollandica PCC 9006 = CALU 1027 TaxID=317619 RepID=A0A0M2PWV9_PROHO|nr:hypothetical protein [Prochlorothrix hollandica]KKJ00916.1 hypothetical protein PROH_00225 [Prochlorothrix hollandica PCC 9006 = CALU 1027]